MGYEVTRFHGDVDEELLCPICSGVLEEPLQVRWSNRVTRPSTGLSIYLYVYLTTTLQHSYRTLVSIELQYV